MRRAHLASLLTLAIAATGICAPLHAEDTEATTSRKLRAQVESYAGQCQLDAAFPLLARLGTLAQNYRDNVGGSLARAQMARDAQVQLVTAQNSYAKAREDCAKKEQPADAGDQAAADPNSAPTTDQPQTDGVGSAPAPDSPLSAGAPITGTDATGASAGEPRATSPASIAASKRFARLLGRWTSRKHGGVIETYLEADGTLSGVIVSTNKVMTERGYSAGMPILRGWKPAMMRGTWIMAGQNGQSFAASRPSPVRGEPPSTAAWNKGGVIVIAKAQPNLLGLPAGLESALSNYDSWVRQ